MEMTIETIDALSQIMSRDKLTSLSLDQGHLKIELKRELGENLTHKVTGSQAQEFEEPVFSNQTNFSKQKEAVNPSIIPITSPMVGVFYESSKPGEKPFVSVGQAVSEGDTLCIIEAMKLMNELNTDFSGKVVEVCVKNGDVVEFGQVLFRIDKGV